MKFSSKRPMTSKSFSSTHYRPELKPKQEEQQQITKKLQQNRISFDQHQNKWQKVATKLNQNLHLQKVIYNRTKSTNFLTKFGQKNYHSQSKQKLQKQDKTQYKQKKQKEYKQINSHIKKYLRGSQKPVLKKKTQHFSFSKAQQSQSNSIMKGLLVNKLFYQTPVKKIGFNMQFQEKLRFEHLKVLGNSKNQPIKQTPIIYFLKDAPFQPHIITQKNTQTPICISLFPQFFHSKLASSNYIRQRYFSKMKELMNNTYDPQIMARMPPSTTYLQFNHAVYVKALKEFIKNRQDCFQIKSAQKIISQLGRQLSSDQLKLFLNEIWDTFNKGNAIAHLDYILKDQNYVKQFKIAPYLNTRVITSRKILYHGGYSKTLYSGWHNYIQKGKEQLKNNFYKMNPLIQQLKGWFSNFQTINFFQINFIKNLQEPMSLNSFKQIQLLKLAETQNILQNLWIRGVFLIMEYKKFLMKYENQYKFLDSNIQNMRSILVQAKKKISQFKTKTQKEEFILKLYTNYLKMFKSNKSITSQDQLLSLPQNQYKAKISLKNIFVLLNIDYTFIVQNSFNSLKQLIIGEKSIINFNGKKSSQKLQNLENHPILKLHIIVDKQSLRFKQKQDVIIEMIADIIDKLFKIELTGGIVSFDFNEIDKPQGQYPEVILSKKLSQNQKNNILNYKYPFIHEKQINQIMMKVHEYYKQCGKVLNTFYNFLPFIKLTTSKYIFKDSQNLHLSSQQKFVKNIQIIEKYRSQLKKIKNFYKIKIFEVDCTEPLKELKIRIDQIEYLVQQKHLNKIFDQIHLTENKLASIKTQLHSIQVKMANIQQIQQSIVIYSKLMDQISENIKDISKQIYFCISKKRKTNTLVTRFQQLMIKKMQTVTQLQTFKINLTKNKPQLQNKIKQQAKEIYQQISKLKDQFNEIESHYFQISNGKIFFQKMDVFEQKLKIQQKKIQEYIEDTDNTFLTGKLQQKVNEFQTFKTRFEKISKFWKKVYSFQLYLKQIIKEKVININYKEYCETLQSSYEVGKQIQRSMQPAQRKTERPLINTSQQHYLKIFIQEIEKCLKLKKIVQIISNQKNMDRHWKQYNCEWLKDITLKQLLKLNLEDIQKSLIQMNNRANTEYQIFKTYENIQKWLRYSKIKIIDINGCDILDVQLSMEHLQGLHNNIIQLQCLIKNEGSEYFRNDLQKTLKITNQAYINLVQWISYEQKYVKIANYYVPHEQNSGVSFQLFDQLRELHRKLIKSFDHDDSIWFVAENIVLPLYSRQIIQKLKQLQIRLQATLKGIRTKYPRLFLLNDQQLLEIMSSGGKIQKLLKKCLKHIECFDIKEGAIQRIGKKKHLRFSQPVYILDKLSNVDEWMLKLEESIKKTMKQLYKANLVSLLTKNKNSAGFTQNYPLQLFILDQFIKFTQDIEDSIENNLLKNTKETYIKKIQQNFRNNKNQSTLTMLCIIFRQIISNLMQVENLCFSSFQWIKLPHFYHCQTLSVIDPKIIIMNTEYTYGFNYLQNQELIFNDLAFFGNTFVGDRLTGKKAVCKYYAYITGSQLLIFQPSEYLKYELKQFTQQLCLDNLINTFKVASAIGSWMYVDKCELFTYQSMSVISQCVSSINDALISNSNKVNILQDSIQFNRFTRVFLSFNSLNQKNIPSRLISKIRPMFVVKPNNNFLLKLYLQSKTHFYQKIKKILTLISWRQHGEQVSLNIINWIRTQEDIKAFSITNLISKLIECGYIKQTAQITAQLDKNLKDNSQEITNTKINLDNEIAFARYQGLLVFGPKSSGKTHKILNILNKSKSTYMKIDLGIYLDKSISVRQIVNHIVSQSIKPQFLLIRNGLQYYELFYQLTQFNVRLIFVQNNLYLLHTSLMHHLTLINIKHIENAEIPKILKRPKLNKQQKLKLQNLQQFPEEKILCQILQQKYPKILQGPFSELLNMIQKAIQNRYPIRNIRINFAKIFKSMLNQSFKDEIAFITAIFLSYGSYLDQKKLISCLKQLINYHQSSQLKKKQFQKKFIEEKLYQVINNSLSFLKQGKVLSIFDLVPTKGYIFSINNQSKIQIDQFLQGKKQIYLNLGYIQNIILLTQINNIFKIKIQCRDWLTTFLNKMNDTKNLFIKKDFQNFNQFLVKLLGKVKTNQFRYSFKSFTNIIVDDVHLYGYQSYNYLEELSSYSSLYYINPQNFNTKNKQKRKKNQNDKNCNLYDQKIKDKQIRDNIMLVNCRFILGMKLNLTNTSDQKAICIKIKEPYIQTIYQQFLRQYWYSSMKVDKSFQHLLQLSSSLQKKYGVNFKDGVFNFYQKNYPYYLKPGFDMRQNAPRKKESYFWFKNPLLILFNGHHDSFSDYLDEYLRIVVDTLPLEATNILNLNTSLNIELNKCSNQLQNNFNTASDILKSSTLIVQNKQQQKLKQSQIQIKDKANNSEEIKLKHFNQLSRKQLTQIVKIQFKNVNTKQIIQRSQVQLLFTKLKEEDQLEQDPLNVHQIAKINFNFQFSNNLKENVIKIFRNIQNHSLILLGELHTERQKALKIASKLLDYCFIEYKDNFFDEVDRMSIFTKKVILSYKASEINQKNIRTLQKVMKFRKIEQNGINIFDKFRFVLKINTQNNQGKKYYEKFNFLKSNFVTIFFVKYDSNETKLEQLQQQRRVLKNGDLQITNDLQLQWKNDMNYIYSSYKLLKDFKLNFVQLYRINNKSQYEKLEYYRKITSQMVVNIDRLTDYTNSIPNSLKQSSQIFTKINEKKQKLAKDIDKYKNLFAQTQQQIKYIKDLLQETQVNKQTLLSKIQKIVNPIRIKMDKIQKKLQNLQNIEYLRIKNVSKNQITSSIIVIFNLLLQLSQDKDKLVLSSPISKNNLISILKNLKKNQFLFKHSQDLKQVQEAQSVFNKTLKEKLEQMKFFGLKRYDKYGPIYKYIFEWLMLYYEKNQIFEDYNTKFKYTFNTILSQLSNLSKNSQKQIQMQKANTQVQESLRQAKTIQQYQKEQISKIQIKINSKKNNQTLNSKESIDDPAAIIKKLQKQQLYLSDISRKIDQLIDEKQKLCEHQNSLNRHKKSLVTRYQNLSKITKLLSDQDYMKSVSSNIAAYFKNIPKISFLKTLQQLKFNQFVDDEKITKYKLDLSHYCNIFSQNQNIRLFKIKHQLYNLSNQDIQYIYYIANTNKKIFVIQDKDALIKQDLCRVFQHINYLILNVNDMPCEDIQELVIKKLKNNQKIFLINDNFYYNPKKNYPNQYSSTENRQNNCQENQYQAQSYQSSYWPTFNRFLSICQKQLIQKQEGKMIILNFMQPVIQTQHYNDISYGRITLTYERFMSDITNIFQLVQNSQLYNSNLMKIQKSNQNSLEKTIQGNKNELINNKLDISKLKQIDRLQIDNLINSQNKKMKQTLKKLQNLTQSILEKSYSILETTQEEINNKLYSEEQLISTIQNNLFEVHKIAEVVQNFFKSSSNYRDQSETNKNQINKYCLCFYGVYKYIQKISNSTENSVFSDKELYHEWIKMIRNLKSDNHNYFVSSEEENYSVQTFGSVIKKNKFIKISETQKQFSIVSQIFQQNIRKVYKESIIRIGKNVVWQSKDDLYSFIAFSLILLFLNEDMLKNKSTTSIHMKRIIDFLVSVQKYDYSVLQKIKNYFNDYFTRTKTASEISKQKEREQAKKQFEDLSTALFSFLLTKKQSKLNVSELQPIWVQLIKAKFCLSNISDLFQEIGYEKKIDSMDKILVQRLSNHPQVIQIIKQLLKVKHSFQSINISIQNNIVLNENSNFLMTPIVSNIDFSRFFQKEKQLILIQQFQPTIPFLLQSLKFKALSSKKQLVSLRYNILQEQSSLQKIIHYYHTANTWIYIPNIINNYKYSNIISRILYKLKKQSYVPNFKIFILFSKTQKSNFFSNIDSNHYFFDNISEPLVYNKYEIYKFSNQNSLNLEQYFNAMIYAVQNKFNNEQIINTIAATFKDLGSIKTMNKIQINSYTKPLTEIYQYLKVAFDNLCNKQAKFQKTNELISFINFVYTFQKLQFLQKLENSTLKNQSANSFKHVIKYIEQFFKASNYNKRQDLIQNIQVWKKLRNQGIKFDLLNNKYQKNNNYSLLQNIQQENNLTTQRTIFNVNNFEEKSNQLIENYQLSKFLVQSYDKNSRAFHQKGNQSIDLTHLIVQKLSEQSYTFYLNNYINFLMRISGSKIYKEGVNLKNMKNQLIQKIKYKTLEQMSKIHEKSYFNSIWIGSKKLKQYQKNKKVHIKNEIQFFSILYYLKSQFLKTVLHKITQQQVKSKIEQKKTFKQISNQKGTKQKLPQSQKPDYKTFQQLYFRDFGVLDTDQFNIDEKNTVIPLKSKQLEKHMMKNKYLERKLKVCLKESQNLSTYHSNNFDNKDQQVQIRQLLNMYNIYFIFESVQDQHQKPQLLLERKKKQIQQTLCTLQLVLK